MPPHLLTRIDVCWGVITGLARVDNIRAAYFQPIHLRLALQAGEPYRLARALATEACFSATEGDKGKNKTERLVSRVERSARALGEPHAIGMSTMARSLESYYLGLFRDSVQQADEAESIFRERCTGVSWEISTTSNFALCSLMYLGELGQLAQRVPLRLREAEEHGDLYAGLDPVCRPGIMYLAADDPTPRAAPSARSWTAGPCKASTSNTTWRCSPRTRRTSTWATGPRHGGAPTNAGRS